MRRDLVRLKQYATANDAWGTARDSCAILPRCATEHTVRVEARQTLYPNLTNFLCVRYVHSKDEPVLT